MPWPGQSLFQLSAAQHQMDHYLDADKSCFRGPPLGAAVRTAYSARPDSGPLLASRALE